MSLGCVLSLKYVFRHLSKYFDPLSCYQTWHGSKGYRDASKLNLKPLGKMLPQISSSLPGIWTGTRLGRGTPLSSDSCVPNLG